MRSKQRPRPCCGCRLNVTFRGFRCGRVRCRLVQRRTGWTWALLVLDQDLWTPDSGSTLSRRAIPSLVVASSLAEACEGSRAASSCAVTDPAGAGAAPACALLVFLPLRAVTGGVTKSVQLTDSQLGGKRACLGSSSQASFDSLSRMHLSQKRLKETPPP
jgi:hypothetical protein